MSTSERGQQASRPRAAVLTQVPAWHAAGVHRRQRLQRPRAHAEQADAARQIDALEAQAGGAADRLGVRGRRIEGEVARHGAKVLEAQLDADGAAGVALALHVVGHPLGEPGEHARQFGAVAHRVQVALEGGLAADRLRFALGDDRPLVAPVRGGVQPGAVAGAKLRAQNARIHLRQLADALDPQLAELGRRLRPHAIDPPHRQRPDAGRDVMRADHGQAVGLVQLGGDLGDQLVGRDADRALEPGRLEHRAFSSRATSRAHQNASASLGAGSSGSCESRAPTTAVRSM
jgi:hypothetical protein